MSARLNQEWEDLKWDLADWTDPATPLNVVLESIRFNPDQVLGSLIHTCQEGYPVAGRVIVQALLPKLILMSRAYPHPSVDHLVAALWIRISKYPLHRRPRSVAANLVLDAKKDVVAETRVAPVAPLMPVVDHADLIAHRVLDTARTLHLATAESLTIVEKVYIDGLPSAQVAELHAMSPDAVRQRCSDTVRRLRAHRDILVDLVEAA
ncbi:MAG: hypothetical protein FWD75_05255 [Propionibacteriaceae bacterium]|nr:hypothetical protein [Propionibacteriaceae bacterium]